MIMNIEMITKVIIPILGSILIYIIVPFIKARTTREQRENVFNLVRIAVSAAEQMHDAGLINIPKKEYVLNFLLDKDIDISLEELDVMIEAAVKELNLAQVELYK